MEFHIQLHFEQGKTTFKKRKKKKKKWENVIFIFTHCFFQVFPIEFVNYRVHYIIVIIIYQNRTVKVLSRHINIRVRVYAFPGDLIWNQNLCPSLLCPNSILPAHSTSKTLIEELSLIPFPLFCISGRHPSPGQNMPEAFILLDFQNKFWSRTHGKEQLQKPSFPCSNCSSKQAKSFSKLCSFYSFNSLKNVIENSLKLKQIPR